MPSQHMSHRIYLNNRRSKKRGSLTAILFSKFLGACEDRTPSQDERRRALLPVCCESVSLKSFLCACAFRILLRTFAECYRKALRAREAQHA